MPCIYTVLVFNRHNAGKGGTASKTARASKMSRKQPSPTAGVSTAARGEMGDDGGTRYPPPPVSCSELLASSREETRLALAAHPELVPPDYDPTTGKNTTYGVNPNSDYYRKISLGVLDPNFGTILANRQANLNNGEDHTFSIALHRPEIDGERWALYTRGKYYEFQNTQHFMDILSKEKQSGDGGIVLDVGMNIGWFTLLSAAMGATRVIAFDPLPMHHFRVCQSLQINGWDNVGSGDTPAVETYHCGVGAKRDALPVSYELTQMGKATFWGDKPSNSRPGITRKEIDIVALDDFAKNQGWLTPDGEPAPSLVGRDGSSKDRRYLISLIKVDVEGYEYAVLDGAWRLIQSGLVKFILAEFQFFRRGAEVKEALKRTAAAGYKLVFVGNWAGGAGAFQKSVQKGGFPTDPASPTYPDAITEWASAFFEEHRKWKRANLMWARNEVDVDGIFTVLK